MAEHFRLSSCCDAIVIGNLCAHGGDTPEHGLTPSTVRPVCTEERLHHATNIANAVMAARQFDSTKPAITLAYFAATVAGDDQAALVSLAQAMLELACELDSDLVGLRFWN